MSSASVAPPGEAAKAVVNHYHLSLKRLLPNYIFGGLLSIALLIGVFSIPDKVAEIDISFLNVVLNNPGPFIIYRSFFVYATLIIIALIFFVLLFETLMTKSYKISLSKEGLEFSYGLISKRIESIEMHTITDFVFKQGIVDALFHTGDVIVYSHDVTTPKIIFDGFDLRDAKEADAFLQKYSSDSLVKFYSKNQNPNAAPPPQMQQQQAPQPLQQSQPQFIPNPAYTPPAPVVNTVPAPQQTDQLTQTALQQALQSTNLNNSPSGTTNTNS